jgi:biopolymer transport protein ExbB/TolQ
MIKAFGALAAAGTPDQGLAAGISEALINTATGIELSCSNYLLQFLYSKN